MRLFTIFYYTLLQNIRDRTSYLEMLLLPVILIFILGMALSPAFQPTQLSPTHVAYLNEDRGELGENFERFLLKSEVAALLHMEKVETVEEGNSKLAEEKVAAFIHLPEDLGRGFFGNSGAGEQYAIRISGDPNRALRVSVVQHIMESFVSGVNTVFALRQMGTELGHAYEVNTIKQRPLAASEIIPGAMDYYAVTMLVMMIMYGSLYAVSGMKGSYLAFVGRRIKCTPIGGAEHYFGLVMANVSTVFVQALILLAFTHFVFGVNWGQNPGFVILVVFILVLVAIGLGTVVAMAVSEEVVAVNLVNGLIPAFTFIAGGYIKFPVPDGSFLAVLQHISPNYLAQTAIFNTIYGGDSRQTVMMVLGLTAFVLFTFGAALLAERRKTA